MSQDEGSLGSSSRTFLFRQTIFRSCRLITNTVARLSRPPTDDSEKTDEVDAVFRRLVIVPWPWLACGQRGNGLI